jgi:cysteine desulfuration protein SufE
MQQHKGIGNIQPLADQHTKHQNSAMATPAFEDLVDTFAFLTDWEDRYRHIIAMGKAMPALDDAWKVPAFKVDGCASQVWLRPVVEDGVFDFQGDSDALIVRGLVGVVHALYAGLPVGKVPSIDAVAELQRLDLHNHLSGQRSNGLHSMVQRIRAEAKRHGA